VTRARVCVRVELLGIQANHSICHVFVFILANAHYTGQQGTRNLTAPNVKLSKDQRLDFKRMINKLVRPPLHLQGFKL